MISEKIIETLAEEYAQEENSCYTNDYYGFIAGFKKAVELLKSKNETNQTHQTTAPRVIAIDKAAEKTYTHKKCGAIIGYYESGFKSFKKDHYDGSTSVNDPPTPEAMGWASGVNTPTNVGSSS